MTKKQFDNALCELLEQGAKSNLDPVFVIGLLETAKLGIYCSVRDQRQVKLKGKAVLMKLPKNLNSEGN